jgi:hypothetical protein
MVKRALITMKRSIGLIKVVMKSSLDCYIVPGTGAGTEITYLYLKELQKEICLVMNYFISNLNA